MDGASLDAVDYGILYCFQENARMQITDVADAVNVADNTVRNRMERLETEGVIEGYHVELNYDAAGVQHYYLFHCTAKVSEREQLAADARTHPNVVEVVTLMTGRSNVLILAAASEKDEVTDLAYDLDGLGLTIDHEHLIRDHRRNPYEGFRASDSL